MAVNPSANAIMAGRVTAASAEYPYGSSKDESSPGAGDGTPYFLARADDVFGFQQALLNAAGIVPSGNSDTAITSQYLQAVTELIMGRATTVVDNSSIVNAYIVESAANQHPPASLFNGMLFLFEIPITSTGPATINAYNLGVRDITGSATPGALAAGDLIGFRYSSTSDEWEIVRQTTDLIGDNSPQLGSFLDTNEFGIQFSKGADVASAAALALGNDGNSFDITGTATITSINAVKTGFIALLQTDAACTFQHHAANLICPGAADIVAAPGDTMIIWEYAPGLFRISFYQRADGTPLVAPSAALGFSPAAIYNDIFAAWVDGASRQNPSNEFIMDVYFEILNGFTFEVSPDDSSWTAPISITPGTTGHYAPKFTIMPQWYWRLTGNAGATVSEIGEFRA